MFGNGLTVSPSGGPRDHEGRVDLSLSQAVGNTRISCIDQRTMNGELSTSFFRGAVSAPPCGGASRAGRRRARHQRDMAVPAMPAPCLGVIHPQFVLRRLQRFLNRQPLPFDPDHGLHRGAPGTPGRQEGQLFVGRTAADQPSARPCAQPGRVPDVFGVEIGRLGPVIEPRSFGPVAHRQANSVARRDSLRGRRDCARHLGPCAP